MADFVSPQNADAQGREPRRDAASPPDASREPRPDRAPQEGTPAPRLGDVPPPHSDATRREADAGGEPLWRDALGESLRALRHDRGEKLTDTAGRAGISPQYLSEIERGMKDPSSEMIAAIAGALELTLTDLTVAVAERLRSSSDFTASVGSGHRSFYALAA